MLCYRDKCWCHDSAVCAQHDCSLRILKHQIQEAFDSDIQISWVDAKNTDLCIGYKPIINHLDPDYQD